MLAAHPELYAGDPDALPIPNAHRPLPAGRQRSAQGLRYNRDVRFIGYIPAIVRGAKIDWDIDVELSPEVRGALKPQDVETLRPGKLRRPFRVTPPALEHGAVRSHARISSIPREPWCSQPPTRPGSGVGSPGTELEFAL